MTQDVTLAEVSRTFDRNGADIPVLDGVTFAVDPGEFVAILGPSGCGKSTILRLIAGLDRPTAGSVAIGGHPVSVTDDRCAVVFQEPRLLPWRTVAANVALGANRRKGDREGRIRGLLDEVGLGPSAGAWPHQLSGGMAQRVALARGLAAEPDVLLLDEPFAALDAFTRRAMQNELIAIWQKKRPTIVFVTHDVEEAVLLGQHVLELERGRVVGHEPVDLPFPRDPTATAVNDHRRRILANLTAPAREPETAVLPAPDKEPSR